MAFNFNGDEGDTMDGFDSEADSAGDPFVQPGVEMPVPGAPPEYVSENPRPGNHFVAQTEILEDAKEEDYEQVLSQVDRRMRVAHFYRSILDSSLFDEETSEAKIVQGRIRKFCNDELEVIFGMRSANSSPISAQFDNEEVTILKNLAAQVKLAKTAKEKPTVNKPTVNKVQTKPPPAVQKVQTKPTAPRQAAPVVPQQAKPAINPQGDLRIPERYRNDETARVVNGKVYVQARNDDSQLLWRQETKNGKRVTVPILKDVTPVAVPTGSMQQPIPMPSVLGGPASAFSQVMQQHADMTLQSLDRAAAMPGVGGRVAQQFGGALAISLMAKQGDDE